MSTLIILHFSVQNSKFLSVLLLITQVTLSDVKNLTSFHQYLSSENLWISNICAFQLSQMLNLRIFFFVPNLCQFAFFLCHSFEQGREVVGAGRVDLIYSIHSSSQDQGGEDVAHFGQYLLIVTRQQRTQQLQWLP